MIPDATHAVKILSELQRLTELGWHLIPVFGVIHGWPVNGHQSCACPKEFSCTQAGKHPVLTWKERRRAIPFDALRREYDRYVRGHRGCDPNWGVVLGRSGLCAIDVDQHPGGADGLSAFQRFTAEHGPLPDTPRDSRGHYLFRLPPEAATWATKIDLAPGVELLTGNGDADHLLYIPPSDHTDGRPYRWDVAPWDRPPAELPGWVLSLAAAKSAERLAAVAAKGNAIGPAVETIRVKLAKRGGVDVIERARRYVATMGGAEQGKDGSGRTFKVACRLVIGFGLSVPEAMPVLQEWNQCCRPPWTDRDLLHKLDDATKQPGRRGGLLDGEDGGPVPMITFVRPGPKGERQRKRREAEAAERAAPGEAVEAGTNVLIIKTLPEPAADPYAGLDSEGARRAAAQAAEDEAVRVGLVRIANEIHEKKCKKFRCPHPRRPLCHDPRTKTDIMPRVRCGNWTCLPCAAYFRDRLKTSIGHHMTDPARPVEWVYVRTIPARAWGRFRKRILRHKKTHGKRYGQYVKLSPDGGTRELEVYTTADVFKHAERLTPQQAKERFHGRMDLCVGFNPRVTTSRGWRLPTERDDKPSGFSRIGEVHPSITGIDLEAFAAKIGGAVESGRSGDGRPGRVQGGTKLLYPKWFNAYQIEWCHWTLRTAMTPEGVDIDDVTGPPPTVPPPEPEIILVPGRRRSGDPPRNGLDLDYVPIET